jgi:dethiobiotin synthase
MQIFVTGTDTAIGKTFVSTWLCYCLKAAYFKPIQSGEELDAQFVIKNVPNTKIIPSNYIFKMPASPHLAAHAEGIYIHLEKIVLPKDDPLIVEGAGGVLVPLNEKYMMIDLIQQFNIPVIVVARSTLGTINHTCLTLAALRSRNIPILGVIINGGIDQNNKKSIENYGKIKVLAQIPFLTNLSDIYKIPTPNLFT